MRRFFRGHREVDCGQIQYLTAKCTRLAHEKAVLEREFLLSGERERRLHNDLQAATARLFHQEQLNAELRTEQDQLLGRIHQQQDLVDLLQQRVGLLVQESSRDAELLRQVGSDLQCLQSSEVELEGLVDELHAEAHHRSLAAEGLQVELRSKTEELKDVQAAHQKQVRELRRENEGSLGKLQETAEQCEWLCQQQRYWVCCVKRFKDGLLGEREALLRRISMLEKKAERLKRRLGLADGPTPSAVCPLQQDTDSCDSSMTSWDADVEVDVETQQEKSNTLYKELFNQAGSPINGYQNPP